MLVENNGIAAKRLEWKELKSPVFPNPRKISRLIKALAILGCTVIKNAATARNDGEREVIYGLINVLHVIDTTRNSSAGP